MKPIFTIHAGEYLVGSHIESKFKKLKVWLPTKDTGVDLLVRQWLVTNHELPFTSSGDDCLGGTAGVAVGA